LKSDADSGIVIRVLPVVDDSGGVVSIFMLKSSGKWRKNSNDVFDFPHEFSREGTIIRVLSVKNEAGKGNSINFNFKRSF
jgi:hypothetical protein